ncbi:MAG: type II toxin-antitoxin system PemK/MazF family toxin [Anaerolineae bacterium]
MSKLPVNRGEVYLVKEAAIQFPKERLPGASPPHRHRQRPIVVLQCDEDNHNPKYPIVLAAPLSSRTDLKGRQDFLVRSGEARLRTDSIIMLGLIQPVLRNDLEDIPLGRFSPVRMEEITAMLLCNLGVLPRPSAT